MKFLKHLLLILLLPAGLKSVSAASLLFQNGRMKIEAGDNLLHKKIHVSHAFGMVFLKTEQAPIVRRGISPMINNLFRKPEVSRPPMSRRDFLAQGLGGFAGLFAGMFAGAIIGGVTDGFLSDPFPPGQFIFAAGDEAGILLGLMGGAIVGSGVGVWLAGKTRVCRGSLGWTILGSLGGTIVGGAISVMSFGILSFVGFAAPVAGAMAGNYLSRKWVGDPNPPSSFYSPFSGSPMVSLRLLDLRF